MMLVIGFEDRLRGELRTPHPIRVLGLVTGILVAPRIFVDARAHVTSTLVGADVRLEGTFNGDVYADRLALTETCTVRGRIFHAALILHQAAFFEGQSRRLTNPCDAFRLAVEPMDNAQA